MRPSPGQGGLEEFLALNPKHLAKEESRRHKSSDLPPGVLLAGVGGAASAPIFVCAPGSRLVPSFLPLPPKGLRRGPRRGLSYSWALAPVLLRAFPGPWQRTELGLGERTPYPGPGGPSSKRHAQVLGKGSQLPSRSTCLGPGSDLP